MRSVWLAFFPHPPNHRKDFMLQECRHFCLFYLLLYSRCLEQHLVNGTHSITSLWMYKACYSAKAFVKFRPMGQKESSINFFDFPNFKHFFPPLKIHLPIYPTFFDINRTQRPTSRLNSIQKPPKSQNSFGNVNSLRVWNRRSQCPSIKMSA